MNRPNKNGMPVIYKCFQYEIDSVHVPMAVERDQLKSMKHSCSQLKFLLYFINRGNKKY